MTEKVSNAQILSKLESISEKVDLQGEELVLLNKWLKGNGDGPGLFSRMTAVENFIDGLVRTGMPVAGVVVVIVIILSYVHFGTALLPVLR
jgi:hypothetical protein